MLNKLYTWLKELFCKKQSTDSWYDWSGLENFIQLHSIIEGDIIRLTNEYRIGLGLKPVEYLKEPHYEAYKHVKYMIEQGNMSHDNFSNRSRNLMTTTKAQLILENVAVGHNKASSLMSAWINSELHRNNLENPYVTHIGISCQKNEKGINFYCQIFIQK